MLQFLNLALIALAKVSVKVDYTGIEKVSYIAVYPSKLAPLSISAKETLTFRISEDEFNPDQVILALRIKGEAQSYPLKKSGDTYNLKIDSKSVRVSGSYEATIYVANSIKKVEYLIGVITVSTVSRELSDFDVKPQISHKFKVDEPTPDPLFSNVFSILVVAPWLLLLSSWFRIGVNIRQFSASVGNLVFGGLYLTSLAVTLMLFYVFWLELNLFQFFGYALPLWFVTAILGRSALAARADKRLMNK